MSRTSKIDLILILTSIVFASGCAERPGNIQTRPINVEGRIILDVYESEEKSAMFIISPSSNSISLVNGGDSLSNSKTPDPRAINQSCWSGASAPSPNGEYLASCTAGDDQIWGNSQFLIGKGHSVPVTCQGLKGGRIEGFLWSLDSRAVAVLAEDVHQSLNPFYLFYALSGHPIQYEAHYLNIIESATLTVVSYKIPLETFGGGFGTLLRWERVAEVNRN